MSYVSYTQSDEWKLRDEEQNILGWEVRDTEGHRIGRVDDMLIDTETEYVETVVLSDGTEYPASDIRLGTNDEVVYVERSVGPESEEEERVEEEPAPSPREPIQPGADAYAEDFRNHYEATYVSADAPYTTFYEPAYLFGFRAATEDRYRDREYEDVEEELREDFESRFQRRRFNEVREAVRYGYQRARNR